MKLLLVKHYLLENKERNCRTGQNKRQNIIKAVFRFVDDLIQAENRDNQE